ncbi:GFA family protein [Altererythrobacter lutimaris]|uniref:GFA family protein n=1 Tax=Altererythrobacter lutimaris TaxID=2743979 RepID=A0A850H5T9_9SPHN|nr:GFA family protein [Altererythrobacter lutimaris]NVE94584.1 GFA family protein [Altererythrobacter lutimaris]
MSDAATLKVTGGCHCGAVRFEADVPQSVEMLDCNCSICSASGYLHLFVPHGDFTLLAGEDALTNYRFGSKEAQHLFCKHCGVKSFYQPRSHPDCWSVHFRCLDDGPKPDATVTQFDGRNWEKSASKTGFKSAL